MKSARPSIAYLIADAQVCGGVAVVCQHVRRLARRGFETCIISTAGDEAITWFPDQSIPVYPLSRAPRGIRIAVATWWETAHSLYRMGVPRKFYFVQSDESRFYGEDRYEGLFARDSYWLDFEYFTEARWIRRWLGDEFGVEARYVPNGIDLAIFHPAEPIEPRGKRPRVLIEGPADMPSKGVAEAFRVLEGLDCETWYVNYRGKPGPSWKIDRYFHAVPMNQMKHIYSSCDILLKMSAVEGSPGPPLEMMACGGACVLARVTGMEEAIAEGKNALVVEQGDIRGAREAVIRLMEDRQLRERLIAAGAETVKRFDWERSVDILEEMFLSPPSPSARPREFLNKRDSEREASYIEAYSRAKAMERRYEEAVRMRNDALSGKQEEINSLKHTLNLKNDELNSIYHSKGWRMAIALTRARHSLNDLAALPFRLLRVIFSR